jgi:hypothetical protein
MAPRVAIFWHCGQTLAKKAFKIENGLMHLSGTRTKNKPAKIEGLAPFCLAMTGE